MIINGLLYSGSKMSKEARNLKRFSEQWAEFQDAEGLEYGTDDAEFVSNMILDSGGVLDKYHRMANELEV